MPIKRFIITILSDEVEPTAASARLPVQRPTTMMSIALKSSCSMPESMSGAENMISFLSSGPLHMSISYLLMKLPPFPEKRPKGRIKGSKINKEEREGKIHFDHKKREFFVQKGETIFGYYKSMTEAYYYKKKLMDNNWDMNALKTMISLRIDIDKKLDLNKEYPVKLNYCPKCRRKLKNKEKECPYCGIDIKDYLYNN